MLVQAVLALALMLPQALMLASTSPGPNASPGSTSPGPNATPGPNAS